MCYNYLGDKFMKVKYIGFPMKDGCHVMGADEGIKVLNDKINFDKIIDIKKYDKDLDTVINGDLELAKTVSNYQKDGFVPVTIGGDHSLAIGSIAGSASNHDNLGVIWLDTHPDSNTDKTTTTHNIHGYPLAASMGFGMNELTNLYENKTKVKYENVVMFAINDIDDPEQELIDKYNIKHFTLEDINKKGIDTCINETISYLKERTNEIHLSFDIDSINKDECPGVNVPNRWSNGIKKEEALKAVQRFTEELNIVSMDMVEYNPLTDKDNKSLNIYLDTMKIIEK